ncbi:hypothetical protein RHMOL_Rhmol10G0226100 [Rhododendron molle]|uniref:Uncharacterized protein n=1 Tax=Rhododendron molle TaxID=49168 RepID=A0ACC0M6U6_RHOML|nr:hypothetical protein RHMOL_Rhmol10G0226100 [Rhododendron molle]
MWWLYLLYRFEYFSYVGNLYSCCYSFGCCYILLSISISHTLWLSFLVCQVAGCVEWVHYLSSY